MFVSHRVFVGCDSFYFAMSQRLRVHWLRAIEVIYAVVALFALTQGPVIRLWRPSEALLESLPNPSISHVHFATYAAVQIPAVLMWARRVDARWLRDRQNQMLAGLLSWLGLSVVWSTFARHSLPEVVSLALTSGFGLYLASSFSVRQFWMIVSSAMAIGVVVSWVAIMRLWDGAVNFQEGYWVGIYFNRNSLAPVTAVAILGAFGLVVELVFEEGRLRGTSILALCLIALSVACVAAVELWNSESQTSPSALGIASLVVLLWLVARKLSDGLRLAPVFRRNLIPILITAVSVAVFSALRFEIGIGGVETQTTAFNQRSGLWSLSWAGFLEKPWHGWGWMSAWHTPLFFLSSQEPTWMAWDLEWSHNGYHDLLLGGGIPAAVFFAAYVWTGSRRATQSTVPQVAPQLLLLTFVLAAATQESFFVGSHFLWALLVASLALKPVRNTSVD